MFKNKYFPKNSLITDGLIFTILIILSTILFGYSINHLINVIIILIFIPFIYIKLLKGKSNTLNISNDIPNLFHYIGLFLLILLLKDYLYFLTFFPSNDINYTNIFIFIFLFPFIIYKSKFIYSFFTQKTLYKKIIIILIITSIFSFLYFFINDNLFDNENKHTIPLINRIYLSFYSLNYYLHKFIYPFELNAMVVYPEGVEGHLSVIYKLSIFIFLSILFLIVWFLYTIKDASYSKNIIFGLLFFIINISLVLHIIPIGGKILVADRYSYLAYLGLFISFVFVIDYIIHLYKFNYRIYNILWVIVILILSYTCYSRNKVWQNDQKFWTDIIEKDSTNHYAQYSLGLYFYETRKYQQAIEQYNKAISINNNQFEYFTNRAASYIKIKKHQEAFDDFDRATQLNPKDYASYYNRGSLYLSIGRIENSIYDFRTALQIKNDYTEAAKSLEKAERLIKAKELFEQNESQNSELSEYYNQIGTEKAMDKLILESLPYFELSVKCDTVNIDALKNRGNAYAILKRFEEAERDFIKILLMKPDDGGTLMNLGNIKHETGYKDIACEYWEKALNLGLGNAQFMIDKFCR